MKRTEVLQVQVSPEDRRVLESAAHRAGMTNSTYLYILLAERTHGFLEVDTNPVMTEVIKDSVSTQGRPRKNR